MRVKAQAVVAAIVAIGIGPSELSFGSTLSASDITPICGPAAPVADEVVVQETAVARSRTSVRRTLVDARTRMVRPDADFDRLDRAMAAGTRLIVT